ncbi:unnamed protein product [Plasmodium vivax]|nr:unnamed protein product [Plasmodium vivax]
MSYMSYINSSNLNMLISRLNDKRYENCYELTLNNFRSVNETDKEALKNIGCHLVSGYRFLYAFSGEKLVSLCKYLNFWLDEQKSKHVIRNSIVSEEEWEKVENLWTKLMQVRAVDHQCKREHEEKDISDYSTRIELMSYCINRDYFKGLCQSPTGSVGFRSQKCNSFSNYTSEYYVKLIKGIDCVDKNSEIMNYKYHISGDCTLYNIPKTFPKCDENTLTIVDVDNTKTDIKRCESTANVGVGHNRLDSNNPGSVRLPAVLPYGEAGSLGVETALVDGEAPSSDDETISDDIPFDSMRLTPPSSTEVTLTDNGPSKPIYYAGLSVSGVFFTSMVLYKYTTLGSVIRSLVSKKKKLRQTTNKHLAEQWLQRTSEYMDLNSESAHYNFPYHNIQNEFPHNR